VGHQYDIALKLALTHSPALTAAILDHVAIKGWLNVELPKVRNMRVDLLGETEDGGLVHIEIQSRNDPRMALRMAEYGLQIYGKLGKFPRQIVLYFGEDPLRMATELILPDMSFRYRLVDVRELDGDWLIENGGVGDNIIGVLAGLRDPRQAVRRVLGNIAALPPGERDSALVQLRIVSGLRPQMEDVIEEEAREMPITEDIRNHPAAKREFNRGERTLLRILLERRFGAIPAPIDNRLAQLTSAEIEDLSVRLLDAVSLEDLFS
jgi:hypothetical protein